MKKERGKPLVVDCHALCGTGKTWAAPERDVDYDVNLLLERGAEAGIDRHCIMPARNETYTEANRHVARMCEKHAGKLIGIAAHSPEREAGRLRSLLVQEVKSMGLRGVRSDGPPTRELLDAAIECNIFVMYYPAGRTAELARFLHMPATAYPKVDFVLPHLGQYRSSAWAAHIEAIDLAKRYRNVYVDTSGIGSLKYLEMAVRELPAEKILFGACAPEHDPRVEMEALRLLKLTGDSYAKVAGLNCLRLLGKSSGPSSSRSKPRRLPLQQQQFPFDVEAASKPAQRAVRGNHPMTRHDHRNRVGAVGGSHCANRRRPADLPRHLAIAPRFPVWNARAERSTRYVEKACRPSPAEGRTRGVVRGNTGRVDEPLRAAVGGPHPARTGPLRSGASSRRRKPRHRPGRTPHRELPRSPQDEAETHRANGSASTRAYRAVCHTTSPSDSPRSLRSRIMVTLEANPCIIPFWCRWSSSKRLGASGLLTSTRDCSRRTSSSWARRLTTRWPT